MAVLKIFFIGVLSLITINCFCQRAETFVLSAGSEVTLPVGAKINLKVLNQAIQINQHVYEGVWTLNGKPPGKTDAGEGRLEAPSNLVLDEMIYTAPDKIPAQNPVTVSVSFKLNDTAATKIFLNCNITIKDVENYFFFNTPYGSGYFEFAEPALQAAKENMGTAVENNGSLHLYINGGLKDKPTAVMNTTIVVNGLHTGEYKWQYPANPSVATITCDGCVPVIINLGSGDCVPNHEKNCKAVSLEGSTTITKYDKAKKILQGYFGGAALGMTPTQYYHGSMFGRFTIHLH